MKYSSFTVIALAKLKLPNGRANWFQGTFTIVTLCTVAMFLSATQGNAMISAAELINVLRDHRRV